MNTAAEVLGVGGPFAIVAVLVLYILRFVSSKRGSETGVVEATKKTLELMTETQEKLAGRAERLEAENEQLRARLTVKDQQTERLEADIREQRENARSLSDHVERLEALNADMRARLDRLEHTTEKG